MVYRSSFIVFLLTTAAMPLSGCVWLAAGGAVAGISAARQERSVGNAVDDVRIKSAIQGELLRQSASNFVNVSTTVVEGRVLLTGRVADPDLRLGASRAAWSAEGVTRVDNDIEVTGSGWLNRPRDIWMRTQLAATLLGDKQIKDVNYTIDVVNGVAYLTGVAQDQAELDRVVWYAERVEGISRVVNYVVLKDDPIRYGFEPAPVASVQ